MLSSRRARAVGRLIALAVVTLASLAPSAALPVAASTPTTPTIDFDKVASAHEMSLIFYAIPDRGSPRTVWVSCDGGTTTSDPYPFASRIDHVSLDLPGCEGYGLKTVDVQVEDALGPIKWGQVQPDIEPDLVIERPLPAITGHPFTLAPRYPADYAAPADSICQYELRWGDDRSLRENDYDATFGALGFRAPVVAGNCQSWTFSLPWVPYPQFELYLEVCRINAEEITCWDQAEVFFRAEVDGTNPRITSSNLPIAQVLPSTYTPIVGQPLTYTRYLIAGAKAGADNRWTAWQGKGDFPNQWNQQGGSTFTFTPWETGDILVSWQRFSGDWLYAMFDPPVRYPDRYRPNTTPPVAKLDGGTLGTTVPVVLSWTGSDRGWGIDRYQIDRSVDGGAWTRVTSQKAKTLAQRLATGHRYRYRVRAIDKAGNRGDWDAGPAFRPRMIGDASPDVRYSASWRSVPDSTAAGGSLHESGVAGATARYAFTGRSFAWVAERGPTHGKAKVYVDGSLVTTVDLGATSELARRIVVRRSWSAAGTHHVKIVVLATAGRPTVDVDGLLVLR